MNDQEVTTETKLVLLAQERQMWLNTREVMTMRYRVAQRIKNEESMKATTKELENCEAALDELDKVFQELQSEKKT